MSKLFAEHSERNKEPILKVIQQFIPEDTKGQAFEVASGTGQHISYFADHFPNIQFSPSEITNENIASINEYAKDCLHHNISDAIECDMLKNTVDNTSGKSYNFIVNINMIHISNWSTCGSLMRFAYSHLVKGGYLFMYGPFMINGKHNSSSNEDFDKSLKNRNSEWGLRDIVAVESAGAEWNMKLVDQIPMPSNNFTLVFQSL